MLVRTRFNHPSKNVEKSKMKRKADWTRVVQQGLRFAESAQIPIAGAAIGVALELVHMVVVRPFN